MKPSFICDSHPVLVRIFLSLLLISCIFSTLGCKTTPIQQSHLTNENTSVNTSSYANTTESLENFETVRGLYIYGHEVRSFAPCNSDKEYWVLDETGHELVDTHARFTRKPYEPIFVEVEGRITDSPKDGFGADYAQSIAIIKVTHASSINEGWGCREKYKEFRFKAQGNEPGWTAVVTQDEVRFSSIDNEKPLLFPSPTTSINKDGNIIYSGILGNHSISLSLNPTRCHDSMSGEIFGWSATVEVDDKTYQGCAKKGDL